MGRRIRWLGVILTVCFGLVILQLTNIQFGKASALSHSAANPVNTVPNYDNDRGEIFAADGTLLADSIRIAPGGSHTYEFERQYPTGSLFSQVLGTCSPYYCDTGVEGYYSQQLGLHKQSAQTLSQILSPPPSQTDDVTLTVDPTLQQDAMDELNSILGSHQDGAIVMIVPKTGAVVVSASNPSYDPTPLVSSDQKTEAAAEAADSQSDAEGFKPIDPVALFNPIEMGSTAKILTTAAIYNLDPSLATYSWGPGTCLFHIPQTTNPICNDADTASASGTVCGGTIVQMLPQSCDPGYAELGIKLGGDNLSVQADLFGFNTAPPLDVDPDSPSSGFVVQPSQYPDAQMLSALGSLGIPGDAFSAFGQQDVLATALQNALVAAGIANAGAVMTPHFLEKITDAQGRVVETYQPKVWKQATSAHAAAEVIPLMEAVAASGTADRVGFPSSLDVAVKTGTAQVGTPVTSVADWMIGFAPANNPKVAIAVVVPDQSLGTSGAEVAGPIVKQMLEDALG